MLSSAECRVIVLVCHAALVLNLRGLLASELSWSRFRAKPHAFAARRPHRASCCGVALQPAHLLPAGNASLPGLFFGQAFTVLCISFDLWDITSTSGADYDAYTGFYHKKAVRPSTMMVCQALVPYS